MVKDSADSLAHTRHMNSYTSERLHTTYPTWRSSEQSKITIHVFVVMSLVFEGKVEGVSNTSMESDCSLLLTSDGKVARV